MGRDTNKLIMFDFGGVLEMHDKGYGKVYDYKTVMADAIRYATDMRPEYSSPILDFDKFIYEHLEKDPVTNEVFTSITTDKDMYAKMGYALQRIAGRLNGDPCDCGKLYVDYVKARNRFIPIDYGVLSLEVGMAKRCLIGAMTNIGLYWSDRFDEVTRRVPYDLVWKSYKRGVAKPNPEAFKQVEEESGLHGRQILLIDDAEENIKAAIDYGWCGYMAPVDNTALNMRLICDQFLNEDEDGINFLTRY